MKTYKKIKIKKEDKVYCDVCGSLCTHIQFGSEYATLEALWGYASKNDGKKFEIHICESCFFEIIQYMKNKRSSLNVSLESNSLEGF